MAAEELLYKVRVEGFKEAAAEVKDLRDFTVDYKMIIAESQKEVKAFEKRLSDLQKATENGTKATKAETKEIQELKENIAQTNTSIEKQKEELSKVNAEKRQAQAITAAYNKVITAEIGSNDQLKAQLKILTAEYNSMSAEQRNSAEVGGNLKNQILSITNELKKNESAIGDNRRNVGNYKDALSGLGGPIGSTIKGVQGFNAALSANPGLAVVMVINQLIAVFKENAQVADAITFIMAGLNKSFQVLIDLVVKSPLIQSLVKLFEDPKEALKELGDLLLNNIINRFKAFGVIITAIANKDLKGLSNGLIQLQTGFEGVIDKASDMSKELIEAAKEGKKAAEQLDAYTVSLAENQAAIKQNDSQIKALEKTLRDKGISEKERIANAERIAELEILNAKIAADTAKQLLAAENLKLKGKTLSAEEEAKLIELQSNVKIAESEKAIAQAEKEQRVNRLLREENTFNLKIEKQKQGETEEEYAKRIDALTTEFLLSEREKISKAFDDKIAQLNKNNAQELAIIEAIEQEKAEKLNNFDLKVIEQEQKNKEAKYKSELVSLELALFEQLKLIEDNKELEQQLIDEFNDNRRKKQLEFLQSEAALVREQLSNLLPDESNDELQAKLLEIEQSIRNIGDAAKSITTDESGETTGLISDEAIQKTQAGLSGVSQTIAAIGTGIQANTQKQIEGLKSQFQQGKISQERFEAEKQDIEQKAAEKQRKLRIGQTLIAGLQAGIQALANTALPFPVSLGALIPIAAATAANVAQIKAQKFNTGGFVSGPGTKTSDSIPAWLSNGEFVQRAAAVDYYGTDFMQAINNLQVPKFSTGGLVTPTGAGSTAAQVQAGVAELSQQVQSQEIRVINVESDFSNIQNRVNNVEQARTF
jgi:hypothetical protein